MQVPREILDVIIPYVEVSCVDFKGMTKYWVTEYDSRQYQIVESRARYELAHLRLVNKAFCQSVSPRLFRHIIADVGRLGRISEIAHSPYATYVRHINIGTSGFCSVSHSDVTIYAEDLIYLLPPCLARLPNLRSLEVFGVWQSHGTRETIDKFISSVTSVLRDVNMPSLEELDIRLPICHDFGQLLHDETDSSNTRIGRVLRHLKYLGIHAWFSTERQNSHEPVRPEFAAHPDETFKVNIYKLIALAKNVRSLAITGPESVDLDYAEFPSSIRLRSLYLCGVSISANVLLDLMHHWRDSIRSIELWAVELKTGTWKHVLVNISTLPILIDFIMEFCAYSRGGTSAQLRPRPNNTLHDPHEIESLDSCEFYALAILQHRVNAKRISAGLPKMRHSRAADIHSMESAMSVMDGSV
ncbi:hypothetical protein BGZ63DRAFT_420207 [Mariannaea sp. PMI_226]|nr:hypothetical protein BGZ63DRAFT_420207 [Mariannaea sp. PMI_226]